LLPIKPNWATGIKAEWTPGEAGALQRLNAFIDVGFKGYAEERNRPDRPSTSRLSPHLRFGEISIKQVWHAADIAIKSRKSKASSEDLRVFQAELGWREFAHHLLFHEKISPAQMCRGDLMLSPGAVTRSFSRRGRAA